MEEMFEKPRRAWFIINPNISLSYDKVPVLLTAYTPSGTVLAKSAGGAGYPAAGTYFVPNPATQADFDNAAGSFAILYEGHESTTTSAVVVDSDCEVAISRLANFSAFSAPQQAEVTAGLRAQLVKLR